MSTDFVSERYLALSKDRLEAYRPLSGSDLDMLTNYFWNIDLVEALVPCLHAVELALRNSIHAALTARYGTNMWFYEPGVLESNELIGPGKALQSAARKPPLRDGRIVAALSFGFWIALLSGRYEQRLWQPDRFALQRFVFSHAVGFSQQQISQRFNDVAKLRNRCFHHEGIWYWATLQQDHEDIHEAIGWISPTLQQAILSVDNFSDVFGGRHQVKADLAQRFGLAQ